MLGHRVYNNQVISQLLLGCPRGIVLPTSTYLPTYLIIPQESSIALIYLFSVDPSWCDGFNFKLILPDSLLSLQQTPKPINSTILLVSSFFPSAKYPAPTICWWVLVRIANTVLIIWGESLAKPAGLASNPPQLELFINTILEMI